MPKQFPVPNTCTEAAIKKSTMKVTSSMLSSLHRCLHGCQSCCWTRNSENSWQKRRSNGAQNSHIWCQWYFISHLKLTPNAYIDPATDKSLCISHNRCLCQLRSSSAVMRRPVPAPLALVLTLKNCCCCPMPLPFFHSKVLKNIPQYNKADFGPVRYSKAKCKSRDRYKLYVRDYKVDDRQPLEQFHDNTNLPSSRTCTI